MCAGRLLSIQLVEVPVGRLKGLPKRLASAPDRLGYSQQTEAQRARKRAAASDRSLRHLYATKRWRHPVDGVRARIIARAGGCCEWPGCGVLLVGERHAPNIPVVDHIEPHKGNLVLFWDEGNLQALCKRCHDTHKQRQDHARRATGQGEGWV